MRQFLKISDENLVMKVGIESLNKEEYLPNFQWGSPEFDRYIQ